MVKQVIHEKTKKKQMNDELFPIVDEKGAVVGSATRKECHSGSKILHPVVHLHVFDKSGRLFLQHRSLAKDIQPGKWDTSVGGHVDFGETVDAALRREAREELGLADFSSVFLFRYVFESDVERELVNSFLTVVEQQAVSVNPEEISEGAFFELEEIEVRLGKGFFTPNFELEFKRLRTLLPDVMNSVAT